MKRMWALALLVSIGVCVAVWAGTAAAESEEAARAILSMNGRILLLAGRTGQRSP